MNRFWTGTALTVTLLSGVLSLSYGLYGFMLFLVVPFTIGLLSACFFRPQSTHRSAAIGLWSVLIASALLLVFALEGAVCIIMALPITLSAGLLGGLTAHQLRTHRLTGRERSALALVPLCALGWDISATPPLHRVTSKVVVNAPPERVWKHVLSFSDLPERRELLFHTGLAYPIRARIEGTGRGAIRYCEFSTGPFVEPITIWDQPRLLRFRVTHNPAALIEWSPYRDIHPRHTEGYLMSEQGQFRLTALEGNRTVLEGTTWYRHSLWPDPYWTLYSDFLIHRIHLRVLDHVREIAEIGRS